MVNSLKASDVPGAFFSMSVFGGLPNQAQATALVSWSPSRPARPRGDKSPPVALPRPAGGGAWMIPLLGQWALQLVENQLAMLLEYAQRRFERMEHRLSNLQGVANLQRVLEDYALASDVGLHFGNVTVGLGKMAANHRSKDTGIPDCQKIKTPPWKVYLGEAQL